MLKDWKKVKTFHKDVFNWKNKDGEKLELAEFEDGWMLWKPEDRPSIPIRQKIKSRSQALKFAKNYMKEN